MASRSKGTKAALPKWRCAALMVRGYYYALLQMKPEGRGRSRAVLTGVLNYRSKQLPALDVFEGRDWMRLYLSQEGDERLIFWCFTQKDFEEARLVPIGEVDAKPDDPSESPRVWNWLGLAEVLEEVSALPSIDSRR